MNQFDRLKLLINDKINNIYNKNILVIGIGGVGGYTVEALVRSGISNITIVDNDVIDITNINRQIISNMNNIGNYKIDEFEKRIFSINPKCNVKKINKFINENNINELNIKDYDYVVDACDTLIVKKLLIKICKNNNVKLISSMGTGNKMDPSKLKITDIRKTNYDPLAKKLRKYVKDERIKGKVMVVSSDEVPYTKIDKTIPSNSFVPAVAGLLCASYVINDIVGDKNV